MSQSVINVIEINDNSIKLKAMQECDSAFSDSIIERDNFREIYDKISSKAYFYIAEEINDKNSDILGYVAVYANDLNTGRAYISLISVKEKAQGKRIGTALIEKCFEIARIKGMKESRLEVLNSNNKAISFYRHHGFSFESYNDEGDSQYMIKEL